jgi:CheY-like chemotaxis protein
MTPLKILIGDDGFASGSRTIKMALSSMFIAMAQAADYQEAFPIGVESEGEMYVGRQIVPYVSEIQVRAVQSVEELLSEARQKQYDLVVTDLDYGEFGGKLGGAEIIDQLRDSYTLALCTSCSDRRLLADFGSRVQILAAPALEDGALKYESLGKKIHQYYQKKE